MIIIVAGNQTTPTPGHLLHGKREEEQIGQR